MDVDGQEQDGGMVLLAAGDIAITQFAWKEIELGVVHEVVPCSFQRELPMADGGVPGEWTRFGADK